MNKPEINQEVYEQYLDATVALFMEHYSAMLTEKVSSEGKDGEVAFPEALDLKCKALIKKEASKQKRLTLWKHTKRTLKAAAVFAIAVLTTFSMLFVSVEAFRVRIINFYIKHGDGHWHITTRNDTHHPNNVGTTIFDINDPLKGLIPDDYILTTISNANPKRISAAYERSASEKIRFLAFPYDSSSRIDSEKAITSKEISISNHNGVLSIKEKTAQIGWCSEESGMMYVIISTNLKETELVALAENVAVRIQD